MSGPSVSDPAFGGPGLTSGRATPGEALLGDATAAPLAGRRGFSGVTDWVFDLDNTLYPASSDLWPRIDARITGFIARFLGVDAAEAKRVQKAHYQAHGTSLRGLMIEHGMDPTPFLADVHAIDRSGVVPDARLRAALAALPGRRYVFTNGSRGHALATTRAMGLDDLFERQFGIEDPGYEPKPSRAAFERVLALGGIDPARACMIEDIARNLSAPRALGMVTVLVVPPPVTADHAVQDHREPWERSPAPAGDVDWVTDDLAGFLASEVVLGPR